MSQQVFEPAPVSRGEVASLLLRVVETLSAMQLKQTVDRHPATEDEPEILDQVVSDRMEELIDAVQSFMTRLV